MATSSRTRRSINPVGRAYRAARALARRLRERLRRASDTRRHARPWYEEIEAEATRALAADADNARAWRDLGDALSGLRRSGEARDAYARAVTIAPDSASIWKRGSDRRVASIQKAADSPPRSTPPTAARQAADAWAIHAGALSLMLRFDEAHEASEQALRLESSHVAAARIGIHARLHGCDWRRRDADRERVASGLAKGERIVVPLDHRTLCESEADALVAARLRGLQYPPGPEPLWNGKWYRHDRIRIAYVSSDFHAHPVAALLAPCLEHHDRKRFEIIAISHGPDDRSPTRRRIVAASDRFIDVQALSDGEAARLIRDLETDIAVDLNGYSGAHRTGILARRPAPVQVNYLGYPGTMGVSFIDYVIADRYVIPDRHRVHYAEHVVRLPHTYLPADGSRRLPQETPGRVEAGLPSGGFVFASFNKAQKIGPDLFDVWMRLLRAVDRSVLWLRSANAAVVAHLRREAETRGVEPSRLIFAPRLRDEEAHLARLPLADLFLDTLPYSAHATAVDALWAGLPVVTCVGTTFAGRVGAGLLEAVGMPELVTESLDEYEALALALARDAGRLGAVRTKLAQQRQVSPLFDNARFTRDLEAAYVAMHENRLGEGETGPATDLGITP